MYIILKVTNKALEGINMVNLGLSNACGRGNMIAIPSHSIAPEGQYMTCETSILLNHKRKLRL